MLNSSKIYNSSFPKYQGKTNNRHEMFRNLYEMGFDIRGAREMGKKPPVDKAERKQIVFFLSDCLKVQ